MEKRIKNPGKSPRCTSNYLSVSDYISYLENQSLLWTAHFLGHRLQEWLKHLQKTYVQCTGLFKCNVVSLDGWTRTFLEIKDMRHWPFCKGLMVVDQRDAGKYFHGKLLQLVFSTEVWLRLERITINPVVSPTCSNQGQLRALSSGFCPSQFWLPTKMRLLQPLWGTSSSVWLSHGERINV